METCNIICSFRNQDMRDTNLWFGDGTCVDLFVLNYEYVTILFIIIWQTIHQNSIKLYIQNGSTSILSLAKPQISKRYCGMC